MKKLLFTFLAALCYTVMNAQSALVITDTNGKEYYVIETAAELVNFAKLVNEGNTSANAVLMADIKLNDGVLNSDGTLKGTPQTMWTPIGGHGKDYKGEFNGNGHTISGLYFNNTDVNNVGLFGKAVDNAYIHDLGITDSYFYGKDHVGGICGDFANGKIENCWSGATVYAKDWNAGGISGSCWIYASIRDCYNIGWIKPCDNGNPSYGGICGAVYENTAVDYTISNCYTLEGKCDKGVYGSLDGGCPASKINNSFVKGAEAFASGEVCYLLNNGVTNGTQKWNQTLGTDAIPSFSTMSGTVLKICDDQGGCEYVNAKPKNNEIWYTTVDGNRNRIEEYFMGSQYSVGISLDFGRWWVARYYDDVTGINNYALRSTTLLATITLPESVTSIGEYAFEACSSLASINIPANVTSIGSYAFKGCSSLPVESNLRYADTYLVEATNKNLTSYTIKDGTKWIGCDAFNGCNNLASITIPNSVIDIQIKAFRGCSKLTSITIPSSVAKLGRWAFSGCTGLETVICEGNTPPSLVLDPFDECSSLTSIFVLDKAVDTYKSEWSQYADKIIPYTPISLQEALDSINSAASASKIAIDGYSQLSQDEKTNYKSQIEAAASGAKPVIEAATIATRWDAYQNGLKSIQTIHCNAAIDELQKFVYSFENYADIDISSCITAIQNTTTADEAETELNNAKNMPAIILGDKKYLISQENDSYVLKKSDLVFADKDFFWSNVDFTVNDMITYYRTFANTNWQPLYVPFAMSYSEWKDNFDVAAINNFHEYTDEDGKTVKTELEVRLVKDHTLKPNHPYLIRAKNADEYSPQMINLSTKKIYPSDENSIVCSSVERKYTFTGTYQEMTGLKTKGYIFMSGGKLCKAENDDIALSPQRWYLKIETLDSQFEDNSNAYAKAMQFDIKVLDDEATGIDEITVTRTPLHSSDAIYNLNGMRVNDNYKGIVIKKGKKVYQR